MTVIAWPVLVNEEIRGQLVDRVVARSGRLQLLRGPAGVGKTTLAAAVGTQLEAAGFGILPIVGVQELSAIPLAALTPLLALAGDDADEPVAERLRRLFSYVASAGTRQVLMIDDGPMLDDITASTVYQLVRVYGVRAVMTARTEHDIAGPLARMLNEGLVETVELAGLRVEDARTIVQHALGGAVEPDSLKRLTDAAGGNPLFLRELVLAAMEKDAVTPGPLGLVVNMGDMPAGLRDGIVERFGNLDPEDRRLCELIALAAPLEQGALGGRDTIIRLERTALVHRDATGSVSLAHPLFAECLIESMSSAVSNERRIEAAAVVRKRGGDQARFKANFILMRTTEPPTAPELLWAAGYAHSIDDHALAVIFADLSITMERTSAALLIRAIALSSRGRLDEADAAFAEARDAATAPDDLARFASRYGYHAWIRRQRPREALAIGVEILARLPDSPARDVLAVDVEKWRFLAGETANAGTAPDALNGDDAVAAVSAVIRELMAAVVASELVRIKSAIDRGRPLLDGAREAIPHAGRVLDFTEFLAIALDGRFDDAVDFAEERRRDPFVESAGGWGYGLAIIALTGGRVVEALDLATLAVEQLRWRDFTGMFSTTVAIQANAAIQLQLEPLADQLLESISDAVEVDTQAFLMCAEARAWRFAIHGDADAAAAVVRDAVRHGIDRRYHAIACMTAYVAVRLRRAAAVIDLMHEIGELSEGGMVAAMIAHAEAAVAGDAGALMLAADALAVAGIPTGAVDAARHAAGLFRAAGSDDEARRALLHAAAWAQGLSGVRPAGPGDETFDLTEREWTVALAAAGRDRSREIADRLGVSIRTVDNHLRNVYRKLGVTGRDELRAQLADVVRAR